jgi:hypothetical protein
MFSFGAAGGGAILLLDCNKIRSKRDRCKKKSRRYIHLSNVYKRVAERKRHKQHDCLHKASHLIAHRLAERAVVTGWSIMIGDSLALCRCSRISVCALGKHCKLSTNAIRPGCVMPASTSRTCPCGSGRIAVQMRTAAW